MNDKPVKAHIYYDFKIILTIVGYNHETEQELRNRVKQEILVVVPLREK